MADWMSFAIYWGFYACLAGASAIVFLLLYRRAGLLIWILSVVTSLGVARGISPTSSTLQLLLCSWLWWGALVSIVLCAVAEVRSRKDPDWWPLVPAAAVVVTALNVSGLCTYIFIALVFIVPIGGFAWILRGRVKPWWREALSGLLILTALAALIFSFVDTSSSEEELPGVTGSSLNTLRPEPRLVKIENVLKR